MHAEIGWATHTEAAYNTPHPAPFLDLIKTARIRELHAGKGKPLEVGLQLFAINDQVTSLDFQAKSSLNSDWS